MTNARNTGIYGRVNPGPGFGDELRGDGGELALQLRADDFASLEQLRQRLLQAGLQVQLGSASREEQGVSARMVIGGGA